MYVFATLSSNQVSAVKCRAEHLMTVALLVCKGDQLPVSGCDQKNLNNGILGDTVLIRAFQMMCGTN